jgi:hypothetical protein
MSDSDILHCDPPCYYVYCNFLLFRSNSTTIERNLLLGHGHKLSVIVVEGSVNKHNFNGAISDCLLLALL